jgi:penicillin-binding protein 1A
VAPTEERQVIPYRSAFLAQQLLMGGLREPGGTSMSLWGYVGKYPDTEFGGKTGTSNNHSDAWFVGVSPRLVAGAWVGGEYRSIHFRTGALGQGSRTALPICGYFFESVLGDPAFKQYHAKFDKPKSDVVRPEEYTCASYYERRDTDSVAVDSLAVEPELEMVLDEYGNAVAKPKEHKDEADKHPQPADPQAATEPKDPLD